MHFGILKILLRQLSILIYLRKFGILKILLESFTMKSITSETWRVTYLKLI